MVLQGLGTSLYAQFQRAVRLVTCPDPSSSALTTLGHFITVSFSGNPMFPNSAPDPTPLYNEFNGHSSSAYLCETVAVY